MEITVHRVTRIATVTRAYERNNDTGTFYTREFIITTDDGSLVTLKAFATARQSLDLWGKDS